MTTVGAAMALALFGASCSGTTAPNAPAVVGHGPGGTMLPDFPSTGDFYDLPAHFPSEPPGTLFRIQTVSSSGGYATLRVAYHSRNASGNDALVTGIISYPTGRAPSGGWPVLSWDHGTTGLSQSCAPSRAGRWWPANFARGVSVGTDYLGLGPDGEIHPYLNRVTEARATIDIVRAARTIPDAHASDTWVVVGDSQGGHASLATGEIAPGYAPELHLVGTVAIAPGAVLARTFPGDSPLIYDTVTVMGLFGAQAAEPGRIHPDAFLSPAALGIAKVIKSGCDVQIAAYIVPLLAKPGGVFKVPPVDTPEGLAYINANDVGLVHTQGPILVVGGGKDTIVVPARIDATMNRLCRIGDRVSLDWVPDGDHLTELPKATEGIKAWIDARLEGAKAPTDCPYSQSH